MWKKLQNGKVQLVKTNFSVWKEMLKNTELFET